MPFPPTGKLPGGGGASSVPTAGKLPGGGGTHPLPATGTLPGGGGSGRPQPADGRQPATRQGSGKPKNLTGFQKAKATGTLNDDLAMGRMGKSYMISPAFKPGAESQTNDPKQLPSQHIQTHGNDEYAIAHSHMDNARKAKTAGDKRKHVFSALTALNQAQKKGL